MPAKGHLTDSQRENLQKALKESEAPQLTQRILILTFPVKSLLQAANPHRGRVILTNLATVPGYQ